MRVAVQSAPFDIGAESAAFALSAAGAGAVVTFTGIVRDLSGGLAAMEIEHYPGMTERAILDITRQAVSRWELIDALVIHRHGTLRVGEPIMMVATAARHRTSAFEAAEFLMDYLKSRAPFWKKEHGPDGARWIEPRQADYQDLTRWTADQTPK